MAYLVVFGGGLKNGVMKVKVVLNCGRTGESTYYYYKYKTTGQKTQSIYVSGIIYAAHYIRLSCIVYFIHVSFSQPTDTHIISLKIG